MRHLASIQRIDSVVKHPNADALDICRVLGWNVVTKRDEFKEGDLCVYCEVDSVLPQEPEFEFMRPRHFRVKTIRLRQQISQGICFPLSILPQNMEVIVDGEDVHESIPIEVGTDVTDILGIVKYEPPSSGMQSGNIIDTFPSFIPKTDETRLQSIPEVITNYVDSPFWVTEKLDGTSATYYLYNGEFGICSRNYVLEPADGCVYTRVAKKYNIEQKLRELSAWFGDLAIQGEIIGPSIQKNKYALSELEFYVFRIYQISTSRFLDFDDVKMDTIPYVPIIDQNFRWNDENTVDNMVSWSVRKSTVNPKIHQEGLVFILEKSTPRMSFKVINPEFLLKYDDV